MSKVRKSKKLLKGIIVIVSLMIIITTISLRDVYINREGYRDKLIRFHVVANSDSPEDQALKLKVRDEIIGAMNEKFKQSSSLDQSREIIRENLNEIQHIAKMELDKQGSTYDVSVDFDQHSFPTKSYGNFVLPAGKYEAVKVVIGEGKGENWWCVMFPPLCFIDITNGLTDNNTKKELAGVLTEDEYDMITQAKEEDEVPLKLKFKLVEIFEKSKMTFAKMFVSEK